MIHLAAIISVVLGSQNLPEKRTIGTLQHSMLSVRKN
jgi:hypothetical protein